MSKRNNIEDAVAWSVASFRIDGIVFTDSEMRLIRDVSCGKITKEDMLAFVLREIQIDEHCR